MVFSDIVFLGIYFVRRNKQTKDKSNKKERGGEGAKVVEHPSLWLSGSEGNYRFFFAVGSLGKSCLYHFMCFK